MQGDEGDRSVCWFWCGGLSYDFGRAPETGIPGKDTIVSRYEVPYEQVYEAAKAVLKESGTLVSDDQVSNTLRARIDNNTVWIKLDSSEPRITTMSVEARTSGGAPHVDLASEIDKRIYGRLITTSR